MTGSGNTSRNFTSWIEEFLRYTENVPSPEIFRRWTAAATIAGALERKVWCYFSEHRLYPNLFTMLVSPPGVGKSMAIKEAEKLWTECGIKVAPTSITHKGLLTHMAQSNSVSIVRTSVHQSHSIAVASSEFGNLVPAHDLAFLNSLNHIWDCPMDYKDVTRTGGEVQLKEPCMNIITGTQPKYLGVTFPEAAFGMGFMSRIIMVYSQDAVRLPLFGTAKRSKETHDKLLQDLKEISRLYGDMSIDPEMAQEFQGWADRGYPPVPSHVKLEHYAPRRHVQVMKLAMIYSVARSDDLIVTLEDFENARKMLLEAERNMSLVFQQMASSQDADVVDETYYYVKQTFDKTGKGVKGNVILQFLMTKMPQNKVKQTLDNMVQSHIIVPDVPEGFPQFPGTELSIAYKPGRLRAE